MIATPTPEVSVVIPTVGRPSLTREVDSVLGQVDVQVEVVVVMNGSGQLPLLPDDTRIRLMVNAPGTGANRARQTGIEAAKYETVALLDDDDFWLTNKLSAQNRFRRELGLGVDDFYIIGAALSDSEIASKKTVWPRDSPPRHIIDVQEYLFRRNSIISKRHQLQSSTLMFPKKMAEMVPFRGDVKMHQDWQWVLEAESILKPRIGIVDDVLVIRDKSTVSGITVSTRWNQSANWALANLDRARPSCGDFILVVSLSMAIRSRSAKQVFRCLIAANGVRSSNIAVVHALLSIALFMLRSVERRGRRHLRICPVQREGDPI